MELKLENLIYQDTAIKAIVKVFNGTEKNTFDNSFFEGIRSNVCKLKMDEFSANIKAIVSENGIDDETAKLSSEKDLCIEMETGTGKTIVYLKTIYELFKHYGFTKFIILVPSIAIRQGVLGTLKSFEEQLEGIYRFKPQYFEYDSKKMQKVTNFIQDQHPQIMVMTLASFNSEDRILNQAEREDLFTNIPFIEAIGRTNPIILMDEPQEGMDTENSIKQIARLNPLIKIRYSATHKNIKNLLFRLTPYDSYKQGLVKKIEVLTVSEKNDEASLKIEFADSQYGNGDPKVKLKAWKQKNSKIVFEKTSWMKVGDNLGDNTKNPSYLHYKIENISKSLRDGVWKVKFSNGIEIIEKQSAGNIENIWAMQIEWLIHRHFSKSQKLALKGIKCLSLVFIDRVSNYMGEDPKIKKLFIEKYKAIFPEYNDGKTATDQYIQDIQGYYFAQTTEKEYTDSEVSMRSNKEIYELILQKKKELLSLDNPVQFIFSHSALGVGWDNPNVFNIATLNLSYSDIKKRQEVGRGLRICVNQDGERIYDPPNVEETERVNQLTVIPNETYETFIIQYQEEIKSIYGSISAGAGITHAHKGKPQNEQVFKLNTTNIIDKAFKRFWKILAKKTDYIVAFNEENLIKKSIEGINKLTIPDYVIEASSHFIKEFTEDGRKDDFLGTDYKEQVAKFTPLDLVGQLSEDTGISFSAICQIVKKITNHDQMIKNPPRYIFEAAAIIRNIELDEMLRGLEYNLTGEYFPFDFKEFVRSVSDDAFVETPVRGVFDKMLVDSEVERMFSKSADIDPEVVCFIKLPASYKIKTPIGDYEPDFGLVMKKKSLKNGIEEEYYFVIETKGTNDINDKKTMSESEVYKINCAMKHFTSLGVEVHYKAPVKEFSYFKTEADKTIYAQVGKENGKY